jgi:hypothetical protein
VPSPFEVFHTAREFASVDSKDLREQIGVKRKRKPRYTSSGEMSLGA